MGMASELARRLAGEAEAVCRAYLPNGRRSGRYWIVGDVEGTPGRSLFVRLWGDRAGRWADPAVGEYGDLLDLIRLNRGLHSCREAIGEARAFLREPILCDSSRLYSTAAARPLPIRDTRSAAARLYAISLPVPGTAAETYLRGRGITASLDWAALRFHPACYYRADESMPLERWPALLGAVTDLGGTLTGLQRTWLTRDGGRQGPG